MIWKPQRVSPCYELENSQNEQLIDEQKKPVPDPKIETDGSTVSEVLNSQLRSPGRK